LIAYTRMKGLDGVAITDHGIAPRSGLVERIYGRIIAIPGLEVETEIGHMIGLGVTDVCVHGRTYAQSFIDYIHRLGGIVVLAHPNPMRIGDSRYTRLSRIDCVEVLNASLRPYRVAYTRNSRLAEVLGAAKLGSSDSHIPDTIGDSYTIIECDSVNLKDIIEAISMKLCRPVGRASTISSRITRIAYKLSKLSSMIDS